MNKSNSSATLRIMLRKAGAAICLHIGMLRVALVDLASVRFSSPKASAAFAHHLASRRMEYETL